MSHTSIENYSDMQNVPDATSTPKRKEKFKAKATKSLLQTIDSMTGGSSKICESENEQTPLISTQAQVQR